MPDTIQMVPLGPLEDSTNKDTTNHKLLPYSKPADHHIYSPSLVRILLSNVHLYITFVTDTRNVLIQGMEGALSQPPAIRLLAYLVLVPVTGPSL